MNQSAAGIQISRRSPIELGSEPCDESLTRSWSGRGDPCGGIIPTRTFRTTFSQVSAPPATLLTSNLSSIRPAILVRLVVARDAVFLENRVVFGSV